MKTKLFFAIVLASITGAANAGMVVADLEDATNGGGFFGQITVTDNMAGTGVLVMADIADPINVGLTQGDILGVGFQIADASLLGSLTFGQNFQDPVGIVTGTCQTENSCDLFTGGGGGGQGLDIVVALGVQGSAAGFIETLTFDIAGISAEDFAEQLFAMRVQSIESPTFGSGASSKLLGTDGGTGGTTTGGDPVPEPGTLALLGIGFLGAGLARRRRKMQA